MGVDETELTTPSSRGTAGGDQEIMQTLPRLAFIGLGRIGGPLAWRLANAGYPLAVYDARQSVLDRFEATRVRRFRSPEAVAADCEILVTALPSTGVTKDVVGASAPRPGSLVIAVGTGNPTELAGLAAELAQRGIGLVDAAIAGAATPGRANPLTLLTGGTPADLATAQPVLDVLASRQVPCGPAGAGSAMQALTSLLAATRLAASIEAMQIGKRFGLDPASMATLMGEVQPAQSSTEALIASQVLTGRFASGVPLGQIMTELTAALGLATQTRTDVPLSRLAGEIWRMAEASLERGADHTALARWYEHRSGTRLRS